MLDWQIIVVGLAVLVAAAYLARHAWRAHAARGCGGACGCGTDRPSSNSASQVSLTIGHTRSIAGRSHAQR